MSTGLRQERLANGRIVRGFERSTGETTFISAPIYYYNDFFESGATTLGEGWVESESGSATVSIPADVGGGVARMATIANATVDAVAGVQSAQRFNIGALLESKFAQVEFRARLFTGSSMAGFQGFLGLMGTLPTLTGSGLWSDATNHVGFILGGTSEPLPNVLDIYVSENDGTAASPRVDTGVDFAPAVSLPAWKTYRIDLSDLRDIKFYVDGVRVAANTTFVFNGSTEAVSTMAITFGLLRHTPEGDNVVGTLDVDYVRFWATR